MNALFCLTVDCDLRVSAVVTRDRSLFRLLEVFEKHGAAGHATWFLNENDFALTHLHPDFVLEAVRRGDTLGVHDHVDFLGGAWEYEPIRAFCARSSRRVGEWLAAHGGRPPTAHRFGCLFQRPAAYRAITDLGYTISSDVCPGTQHRNHTGELSFDNRDVPIGAAPYRHGPDTINAWQSREGPMLQAPMMKGTLTAGFWPRLDRACMDAWLAGAGTLAQRVAVLTFGFHPYEIVDSRRLAIDPAGVARLEEILRLATQEYGARFASLEEVAEQSEGRPA